MSSAKKGIAAWQERCEQLEDEQLKANEAGESLIRLLQRLATVAEGVDEELDTQLQSMDELLRSFPPPPSLPGIARNITSNSLSILQRRDDVLRTSSEALEKLVRQLSSITTDEALRKKLSAYQEECQQQAERFYNYPNLLSGLTLLQAQVIRQSEKFSAEPSATQTGDENSEDQQLLCRHIGSLLLKLLEKLSVPPSLQRQARQLLSRIENGFDWDGLESVLADTIDFAVKATLSGHQDFEAYLKSLNSQLGSIQSFLSASRQHQQDAKDSADKLDKTLRDDVAQMEISLNQSKDLEQLKSSVREQLSGIVDAVDTYRMEQAERESKAEGRLKELHERIEEMEKKSSDIQRKLEEQKLLAVLDPLTGLPNRAAYDDKMCQLLGEDAAAYQPLSLIVCDIDNFKAVNDNYGHLAGDKVLRLLAKIFRGGLRETDFIGRFGGEEFVLIMPNTSIDKADGLMNRLRRVIEQSPFNFKGQPVQVTASFGLAEVRDGETAEDAFGRADKALYQAKESGRNRTVQAE